MQDHGLPAQAAELAAAMAGELAARDGNQATGRHESVEEAAATGRAQLAQDSSTEVQNCAGQGPVHAQHAMDDAHTCAVLWCAEMQRLLLGIAQTADCCAASAKKLFDREQVSLPSGVGSSLSCRELVRMACSWFWPPCLHFMGVLKACL